MKKITKIKWSLKLCKYKARLKHSQDWNQRKRINRSKHLEIYVHPSIFNAKEHRKEAWNLKARPAPNKILIIQKGKQ